MDCVEVVGSVVVNSVVIGVVERTVVVLVDVKIVEASVFVVVSSGVVDSVVVVGSVAVDVGSGVADVDSVFVKIVVGSVVVVASVVVVVGSVMVVGSVVGRFLITVSISVLVIGLFMFSISSWFSLGTLCFSKNLSISSRLSILLAYSCL